MLDDGAHGFVFVLAGEHRTHRKYARFVADEARARRVQACIRLTGHCRDMPAAFAAADTVVVPAIEPPVLGRVVAQAQAMGRPVVTSDLGILPEHVATPPEMPENVRTGWVAKTGDATEFARAIGAALSLDDVAYRTMAARARQFAEYMFAPQSVAVATRAVYTSLLALDVLRSRWPANASRRRAKVTAPANAWRNGRQARRLAVDLWRFCTDPLGTCGSEPSQQHEESRAIRRPMRPAQPAPKDGPRINEEIRVPRSPTDRPDRP